VRKAEAYAISLSDLGFTTRHGRSWDRLPTDAEALPQTDSAAAESPAAILWRQTGELLRFPLAGFAAENGDSGEICFPLNIATVADSFLGPIKIEGTQLERDGLAKFEAALVYRFGFSRHVQRRIAFGGRFSALSISATARLARHVRGDVVGRSNDHLCSGCGASWLVDQ